MARLNLRRVVRAHREALEEVAGLFGAPFRVEDARGQVLYGAVFFDGPEESRYPIEVEGSEVGAVFGGDGAATIARLLSHFYVREKEKRALADETLGRYKELTLLYQMSDALSRVLDVDQVADHVVGQAHRFLAAQTSALLLHERGLDVLAPVAAIDDTDAAPARALPIDRGLEGRVLGSGRAELTTEGPGSVMCAPLRTGESVFGVLRATHAESDKWNAGDLKLLTSIAAQAAAAISHATLHREQLRRQALRGRIERFVSPHLVGAVLEDRAIAPGTPVAVLFCDTGHVVWTKGAEQPAEIVLRSMHLATSVALKVLMEAGATVDVAQGEMLVAVFPRAEGFGSSASAAVDAALRIVRALDRRFGGPAERNPGFGLSRTELIEPAARDTFLAGVGRAAMLQAAAAGRVLVEYDVAEAVRATSDCVSAEVLDLPSGEVQAYEVRP